MALAAHQVVLVSAVAAEVERLAVDEELRVLHLDGADAERLGVHVVVGGHLEGVEVAAPGLPQLGAGHGEAALGALAGGHLDPLGVEHPDLDGAGAVGHHRVVNDAVGAVDVGGDGHVGDGHGGAGVEQYGAVEAGVVVEVVEVALHLLAELVGLDEAGRDRLPGEPVVDGHRQAEGRAGELGDVGLEGEVAAHVADHLGVVDPHPGGVGGGAEAHEQALAVSQSRGVDDALVPGPAHVVVDLGLGGDVVVGGGHRHGPRIRERGPEPALLDAVVGGVDGEVPHPVEVDDRAGGGGPGAQHACSFWWWGR